MSPSGVFPRLPDAPIADRFWARVDKGGPDECWEWQASRDGYGYGRFRIDDGSCRAHRFVYEMVVGPIPAGFLVCHHCDNPPCVNPAHLFLGTDLDNSRDKWAKGRGVPPRLRLGEQATAAVLTQREVVRIRERGQAGETATDIAADMGLNYRLVWRVLTRATWRWVA